MSTHDKGKTPETFPQLGERQMEIYATELQQQYRGRRRLRKELEDRLKDLQRRMRELEALNRMFLQDPERKLSGAEASEAVVARIEQLALEASALEELLKSQGSSATASLRLDAGATNRDQP